MKTTKILTVVLLVVLLSCYFQANAGFLKKGKKINVRSPVSEFFDIFTSFSMDNVKAFYANLYWGVLSPSLAGIYKAAG